jgi:hypothetical protein
MKEIVSLAVGFVETCNELANALLDLHSVLMHCKIEETGSSLSLFQSLYRVLNVYFLFSVISVRFVPSSLCYVKGSKGLSTWLRRS